MIILLFLFSSIDCILTTIVKTIKILVGWLMCLFSSPAVKNIPKGRILFLFFGGGGLGGGETEWTA